MRERNGAYQCEQCGRAIAIQEGAASTGPGGAPQPGEPGFDPYRTGVYYNPADPRLWLPRRNPALGWTVNFAHPWAIPVVVLLVVVPLVVAIGSA